MNETHVAYFLHDLWLPIDIWKRCRCKLNESSFRFVVPAAAADAVVVCCESKKQKENREQIGYQTTYASSWYNIAIHFIRSVALQFRSCRSTCTCMLECSFCKTLLLVWLLWPKLYFHWKCPSARHRYSAVRSTCDCHCTQCGGPHYYYYLLTCR